LAGEGAPPGQPPLEQKEPDWQGVVRTRFGETFKVERFRDNVRLIVPAESAYEVLAHLKAAGGFDMLIDVAGIDYLDYPDATDRYGVVYALLNTVSGERLFVKTFVNDPEPALRSVVPLWKGADWMEREVYDMFGVTFTGHPELRRILMPPEFGAFPLRKDYPLRGRGERHNFPVISRAES
jgi:NADH-quinone oxidoreductase subunit C